MARYLNQWVKFSAISGPLVLGALLLVLTVLALAKPQLASASIVAVVQTSILQAPVNNQATSTRITVTAEAADNSTVDVQAAEETARVREMLDRMMQAVQTLNYRGVFVYQYGDKLETMQVVHRASALGEQERLVSLDGQPMEVVRNNDAVMCFLPQLDGTIMATAQPRNPFTVALPHNVDSVSQHYRLRYLGKSRVAGKQAEVVAIQAADEYRYGYKLWLDQTNSMLLKAQVDSRVDSRVGGQGGIKGTKSIEKIVFTQIEYPTEISQTELASQYAAQANVVDPMRSTSSIQSASANASVNANVEVASPVNVNNGTVYKTNRAERQKSLLGVEWQVAKLPNGFQLTQEKPHQFTSQTDTAEHRIYSDGVASISVFVTPHNDGKTAMEGRASLGALNVFGRVMHDYQITVIGDVPPAAVSYVADHVVLTKNDDS